MSDFLPYGRQCLEEDDIQAVCDVLRSDFLTTGPKVQDFEAKFAELVGARYAVAVNSATAALHLAVRVLKIGPGDRVITSPNTFLASANCAAYVGATPDFADIDPTSYNLDQAALRETWQADTKVVVAVDYAGQPCDMPALAEIGRSRGAAVVEDASHAVGSRFTHGGEMWKVGGHPWADLTVFSFHPVKTMTTGEGGMLVTDNEEWASAARRLRSHGMERENFRGLGEDSQPSFAEKGPWYYEMQDLGYNYRLTDLQCALGLTQLDKLDRFMTRRREVVARYNREMANIPWLILPGVKNAADRAHISWHLYTVQIDYQAIGKTRTKVMTELKEKGVGSQVLYIPVYLQPWYRMTYGYHAGKCPQAERFYQRALSLPLFPAMSDADVERVFQAVKSLCD